MADIRVDGQQRLPVKAGGKINCRPGGGYSFGVFF